MDTRELMWLELMKFYGLKEVVGPVDNPIIVGWFKELGFEWIKDDETAWCSLTINIMAKRLNLDYSGKLDARSWLEIGNEVTVPKIGHIVIFWRISKDGWRGHVGLYAGESEDGNIIFVFGGNQGNMICIKGYPKESSSYGLLGYRELPEPVKLSSKEKVDASIKNISIDRNLERYT